MNVESARAALTEKTEKPARRFSLALPSAMQIVTFIAGISFLIVFGGRTLRELKVEAEETDEPPKRRSPRSLRRI